jgi:hypothetical protein
LAPRVPFTEPLESRLLLAAVAGVDTGVYLAHTYRVVVPPALTGWNAAQAVAQAAGGHLVTINSPGEQAFLEGLLAAADAPTGAYSIGGAIRTTSPLVFGWTTGEPFSYRHWYAGEPNSAFRPAGSEPVMAMLWTKTPAEPTFARRGFWNDQVERGYGPGESIFADVNQAGYIVEIDSAEGVYEAEQASITGAIIDTSHGGFSGSGYVDYQHAREDSVEFTVNAPAAGRYSLDFRYANGSGADRLTGMDVNGTAVSGGLNFPRTGSWRTWGDATTTVRLVEGGNRVRVLATGRSGPNLDSLTVLPVVSSPPVTYQAEAATLSGPLALSDHSGFTGTGFADYQHAGGDYVEFPIEVPVAGDYWLDFRYANGKSTPRPMGLTVNGVAAPGGVSFGQTGLWSTWSTARASVSLPAGASRVRLTATGRSGPNLDAMTVRRAGDVVYLAQTRTVAGFLIERFDAGVPGELVDASANDRRAAEDFDDFQGSIDVRVAPPPGAQEGSGRIVATQRSRLTDDGVFISGNFDAATGTQSGGYGVDSRVDVTFELAQPRDYVLSAAVYAQSSANRRTQMSLSAVDGATLFETATSPSTPDGIERLIFTGRLAPGRYRFAFHHGAGGGDGTMGPYSVELALNR